MTFPVLKVEYLLTRRCQMRCSYCKIIDTSSLKGEEMDTGGVVKMLRLIGYRWPGAPVIFFGGEPTMRDDLPEIIDAATRFGITSVVISNSKRVLEEVVYRERLVSAGLRNWSCSFDGDVAELTVDSFTRVKSERGLAALRLFRDEYGFRDLVTCITITRHNIDALDAIVKHLTEEGIWSICTPIQIGREGYEYSQGNSGDLPSQRQIDSMAPTLKRMAESGQYLMHNDPDWFDTWSTGFRMQNWMCSSPHGSIKSILTVDADGMLRRCVDIPLREDIHVNDLGTSTGRALYESVLRRSPGCAGCLWDPAYESIKRAHDPSVGVFEGRRLYRHELTKERVAGLLPAARKWFK